MAIGIASVAILLLALRPFRIPGWILPVAGAMVIVCLSFEPLRSAGEAVTRQWNVLLFILGLTGISAAAEESGAFVWIADLVVDRARASRRRLFILLYCASAIVTLLLSNDATDIARTPIVYRAVVVMLALIPFFYRDDLEANFGPVAFRAPDRRRVQT